MSNFEILAKPDSVTGPSEKQFNILNPMVNQHG